MPRIVDWPARMREVADFVGLDEAELEIVQATGPLVLAHGEQLTTDIYDHFLKFPETRMFFLAEDGLVDEVRLDRRKHSLLRWLRGTLEFKIDEETEVRRLENGDEEGLLTATVEITDDLHLALNGAGFTWDSSRNIARKNAAALWKNCKFKVKGL